MFSLLRSRRAAKKVPKALSYEAARDLVQDDETEVRRALAKRADAKPEILYYLAADKAPAVRREVAANPATPAQADLLLTADPDDEVRCQLARKIGRLMPWLDSDKKTQIREVTIEVLERLAADTLPRVRALLAEELKRAPNVPMEIVRRLAADVESVVAVPILEYSPLLSDHDLVEVIAKGVAEGGLSAIARRAAVAAPVADAIVATLDVPAVAALLANPSAEIREATMEQIVEHAAEAESWHKPLVLRSELSLRAMRRIAQFVTASLVDILVDHHDLPETFANELKSTVRSRLAAPEEAADWKAIAREAAALDAKGALDDECIADAAERGAHDFALYALAFRAKIRLEIAQRIVAARDPKAITALAWKAGLSMRTGMRLQLRLGQVPPQAILNARNGIDYPLSPDDMEWQIGYFSS